MAIKERITAAALVAKGKVILLKEVPKLAVRVKIWDDLQTEATEDKDPKAASQAYDAYSAAQDYAKWLTRMVTLIKRVSILKDSDKQIETFIKALALAVKQAGLAYATYKSEKKRFEDRFAKKDNWNAKSLAWIKSDRPHFDVALKLFKTLLKVKIEE
jgi:hypothetical protein